MNCFQAASDKVGGRLRRVFLGFNGPPAPGLSREASGRSAAATGVDMKVYGYAEQIGPGRKRRASANAALSAAAPSRVGRRRDTLPLCKFVKRRARRGVEWSPIQGVRAVGAHFALGLLILDTKKGALAFDLPVQAPELRRVGVATGLAPNIFPSLARACLGTMPQLLAAATTLRAAIPSWRLCWLRHSLAR